MSDGSVPSVPGDGAVVLGLRPEAIRPGQGLPGFTGTVEEVEPLGYESLVTVRSGDTLITLRMDAGASPALGASLALTAEAQGLHWFDAASGNRL
jgi:ABC-type sugar transport system ATPase subunit